MTDIEQRSIETINPPLSGRPAEGKIYQSMIDVMKAAEAIAKGKRNQEQGFAYRGIDDFYNELHSKMATHGVFCTPQALQRVETTYKTKSGSDWLHIRLEILFRFYATDGSFVSVGPFWGEGRDSGDKGSNKAHSIAHKYALMQAFMIPTEELDDPDGVKPEEGASRGGPKPAAEPAKPREKTPQEKALAAMFATAKDALWSNEQLKAYIKAAYGLDSSKDMTRQQYDTLMTMLKAKTKFNDAMAFLQEAP